MMYSISVRVLSDPSCDPEKIVQKAAVFFNGLTLEGEQVVKQLVNNLYRITKVCNRNKCGANLNFEWDEESGIIYIYTGDGKSWYVIIQINKIEHMLSMVDVDAFVEMNVHSSSLNIFDQYLAEKNLEKEVGYERF